MASGADPTAITLSLAGVDCVDVDAQGDLVLATASRPTRFQKPVVYQEREGRRHGLRRRGTNSPDFPTVHPLRPVNSGNGDAFVAKLPSEGEDPLVNAFVSFNPLEATFQTIPETQRCPAGFVSTFSFTARLSDTSASTSLADLQVEVAAITNRNLLQNTDGGNTPETTFERAAPFVLTVEDGLLSLRAQEASLKAIVEALGRQLNIEVVARISPEEHVGRWHLPACLTVVSRTRAAVKNLVVQGPVYPAGGRSSGFTSAWQLICLISEKRSAAGSWASWIIFRAGTV